MNLTTEANLGIYPEVFTSNGIFGVSSIPTDNHPDNAVEHLAINANSVILNPKFRSSILNYPDPWYAVIQLTNLQHFPRSSEVTDGRLLIPQDSFIQSHRVSESQIAFPLHGGGLITSTAGRKFYLTTTASVLGMVDLPPGSGEFISIQGTGSSRKFTTEANFRRPRGIEGVKGKADYLGHLKVSRTLGEGKFAVDILGGSKFMGLQIGYQIVFALPAQYLVLEDGSVFDIESASEFVATNPQRGVEIYPLLTRKNQPYVGVFLNHSRFNLEDMHTFFTNPVVPNAAIYSILLEEFEIAAEVSRFFRAGDLLTAPSIDTLHSLPNLVAEIALRQTLIHHVNAQVLADSHTILANRYLSNQAMTGVTDLSGTFRGKRSYSSHFDEFATLTRVWLTPLKLRLSRAERNQAKDHIRQFIDRHKNTQPLEWLVHEFV